MLTDEERAAVLAVLRRSAQKSQNDANRHRRTMPPPGSPYRARSEAVIREYDGKAALLRSAADKIGLPPEGGPEEPRDG